MRRARALLLALCSSTACAPAAAPPRAASAPPVATSAEPHVDPTSQQFAREDPRARYVDPERKRKLAAALETIDAMVESQRAALDLPSLAYAVVVDGETVIAGARGVRDLATKAPADADTIYRIGSITKSFTGLLVLSLRDDGKLSLGDPLAKWIPEATKLVYPTRDSAPLTLEQLLAHRSGLPRLGKFDYTGRVGPTSDVIVKSLEGFPLESAPGTRFSYSNLGFALLGITAARAGGAPYGALLKERIFDPLGMSSSTIDDAAIDKARFATPYAREKQKGLVRKPTWTMGDAAGAGGIYSTAKDMARYVAFQLDAYPPRSAEERFRVRRSSRREAHASALPTGLSVTRRPAKPGEYEVDAAANAYAYGWEVAETCDIDRIVMHNGAVDGFGSSLGFLPDYGVGFVALGNVLAVNLDPLTLDVLRALSVGGKLESRGADSLSPAFEPSMKRLMSVYEKWDEAAYEAMLSPKRKRVEPKSEQDELALYKSLHGACASWKPDEILSSTRAKMAVTCERGKFTMSVAIDGEDGKILGFSGESSDVPMEPEVVQLAGMVERLLKKWDSATYKKLYAFPDDEPSSQRFYAGVTRDHGVCKVGRADTRELEWRRFVLTCERGDVELSLRVDPRKPSPAKGLLFRPRSTGRCPRR